MTPGQVDAKRKAQLQINVQAATSRKDAHAQIALSEFWTGDAASINKARAEYMNACELWLDAMQAQAMDQRP